MKLRTELAHQPLEKLIAPGDGLFLLGSCFTEHIGSWLRDVWLPVCSNPWGVLFNPASIAAALARLQQPAPVFTLVERAGKYYSFAHHGQFAGTDAAAVQQTLQAAEQQARSAWHSAQHLLITFGTAYVYERDGVVVANCHKFPASEFTRRMLTVNEIVELWSPIIAQSGRHFIFTVSPIRHLGDGLHGNQLSKATLLMAIQQLEERFAHQVEYLPVYELFVDDLRDYRFYADDLVHPAPLGIEMVKELVADSLFSRELRDYLAQALPIVKALQHRPSNPESDEHRTFVAQQIEKKTNLLRKYAIAEYENRR